MSSPAEECPTCGQPLAGFGGADAVCLACLWATGLKNPANDLSAEAAGWAIPGHDLMEELSRGGMGIVYRAMQHQPKRQVALKMLLPAHCRSESLQDRFRVEAAALAQLEHPGILPLYQFGEVDGIPYFTMKLATGGALTDFLKSPEHQPSPRTAAEWVERLASTLHYAHQRGILHRDIKPGNILFDESGQPCLSDFGLAKLLDEDAGLTRTTHVLGTPCYLPPEVTYYGSKAATTSSDIYSLGAVFYEMLAGRPPFILEGMAAILRQIADEMPEAPSTLISAVPRDLEIICMTCLAKEPGRRYASADDLAADLRRWRTGAPILARRAGGGERLAMWARRKPALAGVSAALILTAVSGTTLLWQKNTALEGALATTRNATARAETRAEFLLGAFADSLEDLGRVDLLDQAWSSLDATGTPPAADDSRGSLMYARLFLRWSRVLLAEGRWEEAGTKARAALDFLPALPPEEVPGLERDGKTALAWCLADESQYEEAAAAIESVREIIPWKHPGAGARGEAEASLAQADLIFRQDQGAAGPDGKTKVSAALEYARAALLKAREWRKADPDNPEAVFMEIRCQRAEARAQYYLRGNEEAFRIFTQARDASAILAARPKPPARWQELHADLIGWVGQAASRLGESRQREAELGLTGELKAVEEMLSGNPANVRLRLRRAHCHTALQLFRESRDEPELAAEQRKLRLAVLTTLWQTVPAIRDIRLSFCNAAQSQLPFLLEEGRESEAVTLAAAAAAAAQGEIVRRSRDVKDHMGWQELVKNFCRIWEKGRHPEQALRLLDDSIAFTEKQAAADPASAPWWRWSQASFLRREAEVHRGMGNPQLVLARTRDALQLRVGLLKVKWELESIKNEVPHTYRVIGEVLDQEKRYEEALESADEALHCWQDYSQGVGSLDGWLAAIVRACEAVGNAGDPAVKNRGLSLARSAVRIMGAAVTTGPSLNSGAQKDWNTLQALAAAAPPEPPKSSSLTPGLRDILRFPPPSVGKDPAPALQMGLAAAQHLHRPLAGSEGQARQQLRILPQFPGVMPVIPGPVTQKSPGSMGNELVKMMSAAARDQRHHAAEHALHHRPAPAFPELRPEIVNHDIQGIQEPRHRLATGGNQVPAVIESMLRPAPGQLAAPAQNPEPDRLPQIQALVTEREIVREFVGIRPGDAAEGERSAIRSEAALTEGKSGGINVISRHDPRQPASLLAGDIPPPAVIRLRPQPAGGDRGRRWAGLLIDRPPVSGLQSLALDRRDVEHFFNEPEPHGLQLTVKMPHHLTAPDDPQAAPDAASQHPVPEKPPVAQGNRPAPGVFGNLLRQTPPHAQLPQIIQPFRVPEVTGVVRHHRDVIFPGQQPQGVDKFGVRPADVGRPVEPV
ncbi:MAG: serine/threonine-protein kinase [Verrucomicrobiota bacterium]